MTALERLRLLAGPGGTTGSALKKIGGAASIAGALLVAYSGLPLATAQTHLMHDVVAKAQDKEGAGGRDTPDHSLFIKQQNDMIITIVACMVTQGEFE